MLNRLKTIGMMAILAFAGFGCLEESDYEKQIDSNNKAIENYLKQNNINAEQSSYGMYYEVLSEGNSQEAPAAGEVVLVSYDIYTLSGQLLETHEAPVPFKFNWNSVIPTGINYGLDVMKKGDVIRMYLPAHAAYDSYSPDNNSFAAYTNFIVEMELVDIKTEEDILEEEMSEIESYIEANSLEPTSTSSGLYYETLEEGDGDSPETYNIVKLHFTRSYLDGTVIAQTGADDPLVVRLNQNALVEGFHEGVMKMKEGEKARLIMPSELAFGGSVQVIPQYLRQELYENGYISTNVKPYSPVIYEVELLEIQ